LGATLRALAGGKLASEAEARADGKEGERWASAEGKRTAGAGVQRLAAWAAVLLKEVPTK